jgi:uncharacterized phosphosugar-binding protein
MHTLVQDYLERATAVLNTIAEREADSLARAAALLAQAYSRGRGIYVFGCTHSAILAEDVFYRAGAPAFWRPLWGPGMTISSTPGLLSTAAEHNEELGRAIVSCSRLAADDVLVVASTSGKNAAPVAVAETALERGVGVIAIASSQYRQQPGNHSRLANLWALSDRILLIDNHVPCGDAAIQVGACAMGPVSTMAGSFIMHSLSALTVELLQRQGHAPPVFLSANAPGGREHNETLLARPECQEAFLLP